MSDNLTGKFGGFESLVTNQHNATLQKLSDIYDRLSELANKPTQDNTAILAALAAQGLLLDSINNRIGRLVDAIAPEAEPLPTGEKTAMAWATYRLMDATAPEWPRSVGAPLYQNLGYFLQLFENVVGTNDSADSTIAANMEKLRYVLGRRTEDGAESVLWYLSHMFDIDQTELGILANIQDATQQSAVNDQITAQGKPPLDSEVASCYVSSYMYQGADGRVYATWDGPPLGTVYGPAGEYPAKSALLPVSGSWAGWTMYIQSNSQVASLTFSNQRLRSTNQKIAIDSGVGLLVVSVPEGHNIRAWICPPEDQNVFCTTITGVSTTVNGNPIYAAAFTGQLGIVGATQDETPNQQAVSPDPIWFDADRDYTITPNQTITIYHRLSDISTTSDVVSPGHTFTIPIGWNRVAITASGPFTATMCIKNP